jgi:hypothetical protein
MSCRHSLVLLACLFCALPNSGCGGDPGPSDLLMQSMQKSTVGDHAGALADITSAIGTQPRDPNLYIVRGGVHESMGDLAATVADYEKAIGLNPSLAGGLKMQLDHLRSQLGTTETPADSDVQDGDVRVTKLAFCSSKPAGHDDYDERPEAIYAPGETVWIYLDLMGLAHTGGAAGARENAYAERLRLQAPSRKTLMDQVVIDTRREVGPGELPDQMFLRNEIAIPPNAPAGLYEVRVTVTDKLSGKTADRSGWFTVRRASGV